MTRRQVWYALVLSLFLAACGPQAPIKLGFVSGQTGRFADLGSGGLHGAMLAVELRNAAGGVDGRTLLLLVRDDQHKAESARQAMQSLIDEGVVAVVGPMTSAMATELVPLADANKLVLMGGTVVTRKLTARNDQFLRAISDSSVYAVNTARFQLARFNPQRVAVVFDVANRDYAEDWANSYADELARQGRGNTERIAFDSRLSADVNKLAQQIMQSRPDTVNLVCGARSAAMLAKELRRLNPSVRLAAAAWAANEQLIEMGEDAVEGMYVEQYHDLGDQSKAYQNFQKAFVQRFQRPPDYAAVVAYDAANIVIDALSATQQRDALKAAILGRARFAGLQSEIALDANGDAQRPAYMSEIRNARFVPLNWHAKP